MWDSTESTRRRLGYRSGAFPISATAFPRCMFMSRTLLGNRGAYSGQAVTPMSLTP